MSDRYTISVVYNERIAHIGYYRNWDTKDLFYEAIAIAATYSDCRSLQEFRWKKFGRQDFSYVVEPELIENTDENLEWMQECSEFPLVVDMSNQCIYCADRALEMGGWKNIPSIMEMFGKVLYYKTVRFPRDGLSIDDFDDIMDYFDSWESKSEPVCAPEQIGIKTEWTSILYHCRMPLDNVDMKNVKAIFQEWTEAPISIATR